MPFTTLSSEWNLHLKPEFEKPYYSILSDSVNSAYKSHSVFPPNKLVFNALNLCPFNNIKVVIIGHWCSMSYYNLCQKSVGWVGGWTDGWMV